MAATGRSARLAATAIAIKNNPAIQRAIQDAELRENVRVALLSARSAYGRLNNGKPAAKVLAEDKKFQKDIREATIRLREAGEALREGPVRRRRKRRLGRLILVGIVGAGLALTLSEGLRNKVLDALFGAEEEFEYTSTTTPAPAPEAVGTPS